MAKRLVVYIALISASALWADAKEIARAELGRQIELLKKGDLEGLRARFTARQKPRVTPLKVKKAQSKIQIYTLDELVAGVHEGQYEGKRFIKIKMRNGRTLTTLVEEGGQWFSDTIWFR